jgi:hypothetical protein
MKIPVLACLCFGLLAGCATATREKYEAALGTWVGKPEEMLVAAWGTPSGGSYAVSKQKKFLTYVHESSETVPGTPPSYQSSKSKSGKHTYFTPYGGRPERTYHYSCRTTFLVEGGIIKSWQIAGNGCVSD